MKTSFLFIQLQAPTARALSSRSPAAAAWTAAPGGPEEGHIFPSPRTGFLAGQDLRHTQGLAAPPSRLLQKGGSGTEKPAAFSCSALKEEEREEKPQDLDVRRGGVCRAPRHRPSPAPASRKFGRLQPLSCRLPSPAPVMSNESSNSSMGWENWPVITAPQDLWSMDPRSWDALGCSIPQATLAHATDRGESAMLRRGVATCQGLPKSCEEGTSTTMRARRARLYRYCPPIQTSKSYTVLPSALPLKVRKPTWLNSQTPAVPSRRGNREWGVSTRAPSLSHLDVPCIVSGVNLSSKGTHQPQSPGLGPGSFLCALPPFPAVSNILFGKRG